MELKKNIRIKILENRKNFDENLYISANTDIVKSVQNLINRIGKENVVGLYWPILGEPNLLQLASDIDVAIPQIQGYKMHFVQYKQGEALEKSEFNALMQPKNDEKLLPNIVVIPALAYSVDGNRLGFGKGYYDRYFALNDVEQKMVKIGVCFHENLYEFLPREAHDITIDYVVTDKIMIVL